MKPDRAACLKMVKDAGARRSPEEGKLGGFPVLITFTPEQIERLIHAAWEASEKAILGPDTEFLLMTRAEFKEQISAAETTVAKRIANLCEEQAQERLREVGTYEPDTNAAYYTGTSAGDNESRDEECYELATKIRTRFNLNDDKGRHP